MPTGFIYIVATAKCNYRQCGPSHTPPDYHEVPLDHGGRLYFGFCKDTFQDAFNRFPNFRTKPGGSVYSCKPGIIEVEPVNRPTLPFPLSQYRHIPGSIHTWNWENHLRNCDAFFECDPANCPATSMTLPSWLGPNGPAINGSILNFLQHHCDVWGNGIGPLPSASTTTAPVSYIGPKGGRLSTSLHLETRRPDILLELICNETKSDCLKSSLPNQIEETVIVTDITPQPRAVHKCS